MKRVVILLNGTDQNGKVVMITHSLEELLLTASNKFSITATKIFTQQGGEIEDIKLIRDDDILYISSGEDFIEKITEKHQFHRQSDWVTLNVGGKCFSTTRSTLTRKEPMSMLARMFSEQKDECRILPSDQDVNGAYMIDRSPTYFEPLLNYLRHGQLLLDSFVNPTGVLEEARFYGIEGAVAILEEMSAEEQKRAKGTASLTRHDVLKAIMMTPSKADLRFQGVNLAGADLSKLDLRNINFKYANLHGCNLAKANLSGCCLERANLEGANLSGANLSGVKMLCANLESANLQSCNFEDPSGLPAIMEGANFKGANLENSNMTAVNLRVATLRSANLKNCDLRAAVLAGADLENCNLSGSDLQSCNLRGSNLKDAVLDAMLTPLHMSQTVR